MIDFVISETKPLNSLLGTANNFYFLKFNMPLCEYATLNVLQMSIGFFFMLFAAQSQNFVEETILNSYADKGKIPYHVGYIR